MRNLAPYLGTTTTFLFRRRGVGVPSFVTNSLPDFTLTGSTVTYTPGVYTPTPTGVLATYYLNDVAQAPGVITFPYTLAPGSNLRSTELPSSVGYASSAVPSDVVFNPMGTDLATGDWTTNEATDDVDTRKTFVRATVAPQAGKEWRAYRGPNPLGDLGALALLALNAGNYEWTSGGLAGFGATVYVRIAETDVGGANARWASEVKSFVASNIPVTPTGLTVSQGTSLGAIDVLLSVAGDGRGRVISGPFARVNGGAYFALTPSGGITGLRTFTTVGAEPVSVDVIWRNANGDSTAVNFPAVSPGIASTAIATTDLSSFNFDGETFTFASPAPVGTYYGGEPFAITTAPISITAMGTPSVLVDGTIAHGAMSNAYIRDTSIQGFDGLIAITTVGEATPLGSNIDPTATGTPYAIATNAEHTVTKSKRVVGATAAHWQKIEKYLPFTFLPSTKAPQVGDFRPGICSTDKTARLNINTLDFGCCRSINLAGLGYPTVATALARWRKAMPYMGKGGEALRAMQVLSHVDNTNYSAQYATDLIGDLGALFHASTTTNAERLQMAAAIAPVAIDIAAQVDRGFIGGTGAGQHEFYHPVLAWAAALFNSSYMLNAFNTILSNLDQTYWIESAPQINQTTAWPFRNESGENEYVVPFTEVDMGKAIWGGSDGGFPQNFGHGSQLNRTYGDSGGSGKARADTWLPVLFIVANRSMPSGPDMLKGGAGVPENNTYSDISHRSSMIHYIDREMTIFPRNDSGAATRTQNLWATHRSLIPVTYKAQLPNTLYYSNFVAGANSVTWNYNSVITGNYFSSTPITDQHLYISQDNIQFVKVPSIAATGSHTIPGGIPHWCSLALQNAQGEGQRSYTFKHRSQSALDRGYVVPTGTPTGAVTCTTNPVLMRKTIESHPGVPWFTPISTTVPAGSPIYVGSGFWTGALSGNPTIQMQRETTLNAEDWVDIGAVTFGTSQYLMVAADTGKRLRARVTRNGVSVNTAPITLATMTTIPAGTIIDTEFGPDFQLYYPDFWASLALESSGGTATHEPFRQWTDLATADGGVRAVKTASYPRITGMLSGLVIGQVYRVIAEVPIEGDGVAWNANGVFKLATTELGTDIYSASTVYDTVALAQPRLLSIDTTFTATTTTLWVGSSVATATGGASGGNPAMSKLSVKLV